MKPFAVLIGVAVAILAGTIASAQTPAPTIDSLIGNAKSAAGTDWAGTFLRLCIPPPPAPARGRGGAAGSGSAAARGGARGAAPAAPAKDTWYAEPAKVSDNFYFLGTKIHSAWAIVGSDGIIILEALFDYAAQDEIIDGMKKAGLDTNKVKYIIISHAHADHDGGAKLLQDAMPGAHLVYGAEDWDSVDKSTNHAGGKPKHDLVATDGMRFSVGDTSLEVITMPGHTPGTLSYLFEVKDHGKPLRIAYVGGTAIPFNGDAAYYDGYLTSSRKMARAADAFGATALLSNHTEFDNAYFKAHTAADRKPGEANPFDVGKAGVARYFTVVQDCTTATMMRAAGQK